jgi:hypothetical protein
VALTRRSLYRSPVGFNHSRELPTALSVETPPDSAGRSFGPPAPMIHRPEKG